MKRTSSTKAPAISDDAPKLTAADFKRATYRVAGKSATEAQWQAAVRARMGKRRISIMLDAPIIEHFKAAAGERGTDSEGAAVPLHEKLAKGASHTTFVATHSGCLCYKRAELGFSYVQLVGHAAG